MSILESFLPAGSDRVLDTLDGLAEMFAKKDKTSHEQNPVLALLRSNPTTSKEADEIIQTAEKGRSDIFSESFRLLVERYGFEKLMPLIDAWSHTGGKLVGFLEPDEEVYPWQNEFEFTTAIMILLPDFMVENFPVVKNLMKLSESPTFLKVVEFIPLLGEDFAKKIKKDQDIDDILKAFRIIHQEIIVGSKLGKKIIQLIK